MRKINRISISILMIFFMAFAITPHFFIIPSTIQTTTTFDIVDIQEPEPKTSQFVPRTIRVAIYNEPNITAPGYVLSGGVWSNNYTAVKNLLLGAGYQVDELTCNDIFNHKLMTADYDVFIMVDNNPRENITNFVKEFWLGGGGVMSFDSAISYICYAGMIPPESEGLENVGVYWSYPTVQDISEITTRHPVTKEYQIGDTIIEDWFLNWAAFNWSALMGSIAAPDLVKLATNLGEPNEATVVAHDPSDRGGRVIQMFGDGNIIDGNRSDIILDSIEWLCPRPKGRIVFDLSHTANYGLDLWDEPYVYEISFTDYYGTLRDILVNHSYTIDKLYPSAIGNLTINNLEPYDLLILCLPNINFTAAEVSNVQNWINDGGNLLAMGDNLVLARTGNLNYLLSFLDLSIISGTGGTTLSILNQHPTTEGCTQITTAWPGIINYTGNAGSIWGSDPSEPIIGYQEYGNGRVILSADSNIFDNDRISLTDNLQYGINVANWLTAAQAKVLVYIDDYPGVSDPNDNPYKGPVATALNDLGIPFYLTFTGEYLNLSLNAETWKLVIVDNNYYGELSDGGYLTDILDYMKSGGMLIIRSWKTYFYPTNSLWQYLGYTPNGTRITSFPPVINIWDPTHRIFNNPVQYGANNLSTSLNPFVTDFCYVTLHNNATAIAGIGTTVNNTRGGIILSVNGRAITNTMCLAEYYSDTDDSTYPDALEIWENEIAYMTYQSLSVNINYPHTDDAFNATAPDFTITTGGIIIDKMYYTLNGGSPHEISSTSGTIYQGAWDALPDGNVTLRFYVEDTAGSFKYEEVRIAKDTQAPIIEIISPTNGEKFNTTAPQFIVNITDDHLDKTWYTVNTSLIEYLFTSDGMIDQDAWDALSEGTVTIRFYANDTLGHESSAQVSIIIELPKKKGKIIPGFNSYIIIGVISVISVLILEKKLKHYKLKK